MPAIGVPGREASYRQKRDKPEESVEGFGDRIEFDGRADDYITAVCAWLPE